MYIHELSHSGICIVLGGFYTIRTTKGLRIVGLNTVFYYVADKLTTNLADPAGQFAWLEEVLQNATNVGEKVYLLLVCVWRGEIILLGKKKSAAKITLLQCVVFKIFWLVVLIKK